MDKVVSKKGILANKKFSIVCNFLIFMFSLLGFGLSCIFAVRDGYSHWFRRLLYFTQQSNLWIGITSLIFAVMLILNKNNQKQMLAISVFKYIFTVSITITGIIFCVLLAPFADYDIWTFATVLTHVVVPIFSIFDFFVNPYILKFDKKYRLFSIIPPFAYFVITTILCLLKVDFGRGDAFPYFFFNFYSVAGLFGFVKGSPPQMGSVCWMIFLLGFIYLISIVYYKIHAKLFDKRQNLGEDLEDV